MVIGNGMVAKAFDTYKNDNRFILFASGVSNSKNTDTEAYNREIELLQKTMQQYADKTLVYFSTCSIYDPAEKESLYVKHKLAIEDLVQKNQASYYLFRVSNLVGKPGNSNTVLNFFAFHIRNKINFDLWVNATRNLLDVEDMFSIVHTLLQKKEFENTITNIANPESYPVKNIITALEQFLQIRANYIPVQKGQDFIIDTSAIEPHIKKLGIQFKKDYLVNLLRKYYSRP